LVTFDTKKLLRESFGNPTGLVAFVTAYGVQSLSAPTVEKWFQRGRVPSEWLPLLLALLELDSGMPIRLACYLGRLPS
jgi:hypothetical protein